MIEVEGLYWRYSGAKDWALRDVDLAIGRGEFVCIVGPNDSGKTTLAMCMNGLIPNNYQGVFRGDVIVDGMNTKECEVADIAQKVGIVFSDPESQFLSMTVEEEIVFGLENMGLGVEEIEDRLYWALEITKISEDYLEKPPYELSGGEKQRVAIAAILAMRPEILVLDEPTSMLDPIGKTEIIDVLKELKKSYNATIIVIEHRLEDIAGLADRMILLYEGRILKDEAPEKFFDDINFLLNHYVYPPDWMVLVSRLRSEGLYSGRIPLSLEESVSILREVLG